MLSLPFPPLLSSHFCPLLSSVCREVFPSARRQTGLILSFTHSRCLLMTAHVLTALSTPSMRRWPVLRLSLPCRLSPRCTMWSTIQPHLPPLLHLRLLPRPPPPAWTHLWAAWMSQTLSLWPGCLPVSAVQAPLIRHGTLCMSPKPFASSRRSPSFKLLDNFCLSCTRLWCHTHPHPSLWKATSTTFCMRCPCLLLAGLWGSTGCRDTSCVSGLGLGSFQWGNILLEKPSPCWVWTIWWNC